MTAVWFTYGLDGPPLLESVAAFRRAAGPGWRVAIADEDRLPLAPETLAAAAPDIYFRTSFPRGRSLVGWPCVFGMLATMQDLAGEDGILKVDSDTLVLSLGWLDTTAPACGFMRGLHAYLSGLAYWLSADAIRTIRASLASRLTEAAASVPEDQAITAEALWRHGLAARVHSWDTGFVGSWQYTPGEPARCASKSVITFGTRVLIEGKCASQKRETMALQMARFRRSLTSTASGGSD